MSLPNSIAQIQRDHVVMELECIDRMYLNASVPKLTSEAGVASYFRYHLGHRFASTKQAAAITDAFIVQNSRTLARRASDQGAGQGSVQHASPALSRIPGFGSFAASCQNLTHLQQVLGFKVSSPNFSPPGGPALWAGRPKGRQTFENTLSLDS